MFTPATLSQLLVMIPAEWQHDLVVGLALGCLIPALVLALVTYGEGRRR